MGCDRAFKGKPIICVISLYWWTEKYLARQLSHTLSVSTVLLLFITLDIICFHSVYINSVFA